MTTLTTTQQSINEAKAEAFANRMLDVLNESAISLMISIGHRTRLFDTMVQLPPSTSQAISDAAGIQERYVREWLGAMVTGQIVSYDISDKTYYLPAEHAAYLTRTATPNNIAVIAQFIPILGSVEDQIVDCFYNGGGVPYSEYKRFHQVMAEDSGQTVVAGLTKHILPLVPGLITDLERGIKVMDVGCGSGRALNEMAKLFPKSQFVGHDLSEEAISTANMQAQSLNLDNVQFKICDAAALDLLEQFDLITTFDSVHDQAKPDVVLKNIYQALRSDGVYLMQDIRASSEVGNNIEHPIGPLLYTISCMHCMTVSLSAGGMGLGAVWGEEKALQMLEEAGFRSVEIKQLEHDFQNNFYIVRKV